MNKISNLGKIILLLLFANSLFASVSAVVDKKTFYKGDTVTLQIKANGEDIEFPNIKDINGNIIVGTSTSEQIYVVNGKTTRGKIVNYSFNPNRSMDIPSFTIKVNGKNFYTNKIYIKETMPQISSSKDDVVLLLETNKEKVYVGEAIVTSVIFKYKVGLNLIDAKLEPFKPNNFWVKELKNEEPREENGYMVYKNNFLVFPQKSGNLKLENQLITVAIKDINSYDPKQLKVFSNDKQIKVTPLLAGLSVQGKYAIKASVDKTETPSNEPVNLTLEIEGFGNIDDIEEFKLDLPDQVVYSSKPEIKSNLQDGNYGGTFTQKISIISDKDFDIPSISFRYFDKKSQKEVDINTTAFHIKVSGKKKTQVKEIEEATPKVIEIQSGENEMKKYLFGIFGLVIGIVATFLMMKPKNRKQKGNESPIEQKIKKAKTDKELYDLLLPYSQIIELKSVIKELEENIYFDKSNTIDKKRLQEIFSGEGL